MEMPDLHLKEEIQTLKNIIQSKANEIFILKEALENQRNHTALVILQGLLASGDYEDDYDTIEKAFDLALDFTNYAVREKQSQKSMAITGRHHR